MRDSGLDYISQSALGLRLNVIEGDLEKEQFKILDQGALSAQNLTLKAAVIGASHILTISCPDTKFHEVFACIDVDVQTDSRRAFYGPLDKVAGNLKLVFGKQVLYEFGAQLFSGGDAKSQLTWIENRAKAWQDQANCLALAYEFPAGEMKLVPRTIVLAQGYEDGFWIDTLHSYPNKGNIVITKTLVKEIQT